MNVSAVLALGAIQQAASPSASNEHWEHNLSPVLVQLGPVPIRYYSLAYLLGLLLAWWLLHYLSKSRRIALTTQQVADMVMPYSLFGILLGGRLGYVIFYGGLEYLKNPIKIIRIWDGGMSSHGGIAGLIVALWLFSRRHRVPLLHLMDLAALTAPIGLFLGRVANFINGELYGRATDVAWAVIFHDANGVATEPRHPSQLYEAFGEGLLPFLLLLLWHRKLLPKTGICASIFCFVYSVSRIVCEQYRQPDEHIGFQVFGTTRGQLLTLGLIALGLWIAFQVLRRKNPAWQAPASEA
jgi:phosphatidylglycerol:prolipoprotein diacylglycerol transferase